MDNQEQKNLYILVTTMSANLEEIRKKMNLRENCVIANQTNVDSLVDLNNFGIKTRIVNSKTLGTSKNRNIAIRNCPTDADWIMFSDDDLIFCEDVLEKIRTIQCSHPESKAIKFSLNYLGSMADEREQKKIDKWHKAKKTELSAYGVCGLLIEKKALLNSGIMFNEDFGPGTENYCGEDTIFLQQLMQKGVRIYFSPEIIASVDTSSSTWYEGWTKKRFIVAGKILHECYPHLAKILAIRSAVKAKLKRKSDFTFKQIISFYFEGIDNQCKD